MRKIVQPLVVMKSMLFPWIAAGVLCLVASPAHLSAAETDSRTLFQSLDDSIDGLMDLDLPNAMGFWKHMQMSATELSKFSNRPVPEDYAESLKGLSEALSRVVRDKEVPKQEKVVICEAVEKDLAIKVMFAKSEPSAPFKNISLEAKTTDGNKEISGCEVWYVQRAWEGTEQKHRRFPKVSSPTSQDLPPGWYLMWTSQGGREGKQKPVTVEKDSAQQGVDLPVPPSG